MRRQLRRYKTSRTALLTPHPEIVSQSLDRLLPYGLLFTLQGPIDPEPDHDRLIENLEEQNALETMTITTIDHEKILVVSKSAMKIGYTMTEEGPTSLTI